MPMAHADDKPLLPELPQGYDLMTISRGPSKPTPGLEAPRNAPDTATILSVVPAAGGLPSARIEWSGEITTGIVYRNTRSK